jgi:rhodanese-related sulfurtransferase
MKPKHAKVFALAVALFSAAALADSPIKSLTAPGAVAVNVNEAKALFDRGAKFVDVRLEGEWARGHIPRSLDWGTKFEIAAVQDKLLRFARKDDEVVFYCTNAACSNPYYAALASAKLGYRKIYQLREGFDAWRARGLPVAR